ncbi:hypothetical protein [Sphingobacterium cavernae]|uniref:hypothetical protein n=1 Tax=Sphingobacterium cavernae TaxID=2592657 RepID=UPI00122FD738|nr:hypothetical protein [Sphingobacterium cavernae]
MKETGMSWDEILYKRSWINIKMLLADAPRVQMTNKKSGDTNKSLKMMSPSEIAKQMGLK